MTSEYFYRSLEQARTDAAVLLAWSASRKEPGWTPTQR